MAASSTLMGFGNALVGPTTTWSVSPDEISSSPLAMMPVSSPPTGRRRRGLTMKGIEAVASPARTLLSSCRDQLTAAAASEVFDYGAKVEEEEEEKRSRDSVTAEDMDRWIRESIGEIVKNIGEAPFLVEIFSQGPSVMRLEREEASPESWPLVKKRWGENSQMPDGIILVEELKGKDEDEEAANNASDSQSEGGCSKTWGLVVQGRGMDCAASCYILNTCRVRSSAGFCTHFCLVRAKCFGESLDKQLSRAWLQGR